MDDSLLYADVVVEALNLATWTCNAKWGKYIYSTTCCLSARLLSSLIRLAQPHHYFGVPVAVFRNKPVVLSVTKPSWFKIQTIVRYSLPPFQINLSKKFKDYLRGENFGNVGTKITSYTYFPGFLGLTSKGALGVPMCFGKMSTHICNFPWGIKKNNESEICVYQFQNGDVFYVCRGRNIHVNGTVQTNKDSFLTLSKSICCQRIWITHKGAFFVLVFALELLTPFWWEAIYF